jgi:large subunit ribosomal protein L29
MKVKELRERSDTDLRKQIDDARQELFNLRFQAASGQLADQQRMRQVRKDIARLETLLRERQLAHERGE